MADESEGWIEGKREEKSVPGDMRKCFPGRRADDLCVGINFSRFSDSASRMVEMGRARYLNN